MKKSLLLLILSVLILLLSCSRQEPPELAEPPVSTPAPAADEPQQPTPVPPPGLVTLISDSESAPVPTEPIAYFEMSDDIFDFTVKIDGDVFELPVPLEVFMSYGWTSTRELTGTLLPGEDFGFEFDRRFMFTRGDSFIDVRLGNMSDEVRDISNSTIIGLSTYFTKATIELPHGITKGISTMDDVLSAFGEPDDTFDNTFYNYLSLTYSPEGSFRSSITIEIDYNNGNVVRNISVSNRIQIDSDLISDPAEVYDEMTDRERNYSAPAELGNDLSSFNVEIYGDLYRLPAPVSAFLDNGWEFDRDSFRGIPSESIPRQRDVSGYNLIRGDDGLRVKLFNFGDKLLVVERCFVIELSITDFDNGEHIRLPAGITIGTTERRLVELFGDLLGDVLETSPTDRQYRYNHDGSAAWNHSYIVFFINFDESSQAGDEFIIHQIRLQNIELD